MKTYRGKKTTAIVSVLLAVILLCACGSKVSEEYSRDYAMAETAAAAYDYMYEEAAYGETSEKEAGIGYSNSGTAITEEELAGNNNSDAGVEANRKLIRNINVCLQTEKYDLVRDTIKKNIEDLGGYIENSSEYLGDYYSNSNRNGNITARIPADKTDEFIGKSFSDAYITSMDENTEDISLRYSDLETRLKTLETERDSLMALMAKAEDVDSIIALEARLSEVRYELESITSSLKNYDNHVTYSTVWIYITEVSRIEASPEASFGERIASGFATGTENFFSGLGNFAVWFISNIFTILLFAAIVTGVVLLIKKVKKSKYEKKNKETNEITEEKKE